MKKFDKMLSSKKLMLADLMHDDKDDKDIKDENGLQLRNASQLLEEETTIRKQ